MAHLQMNLETNIVLDGLPRVSSEKRAMFEKLLQKKISEVLGHTNYTIKLVDGDDGIVTGAFIDCKDVASADRAAAKLNKLHFTKSDIFLANRWSDFAESASTPDEYAPLDEDDEAGTSVSELTNPMMTDLKARPQLLIKAGEGFDVHWSWLFPTTGRLEPVKLPRELEQWSIMDRRAKRLQPGLPTPLPMWSPLGTYVISQDKGCVKLWGGKGTGLVAEFPAPELRYLQMSPCEKYLVLYGREFTFYDVATSRLVATIPGEAPYWPVFKYNSDDSLCATFTKDKGTILIFKAHTMELQVEDVPPRWTIREEGMNAFAWSPTIPEVFSFAVAGDEHTGFRVQIARITLLPDQDGLKNMCDIRELARRNYLKTKEIDLLWHPLGTYLAAKITKNNDQTAFGIFRVGPTSASAEALELKGEPIRFAWQPNAPRFSIIMAETKSSKQCIQFYDLMKPGFKEQGNFVSGCQRLFWANRGTRCVAINFTTSRLEFYGVQGCGPFPSEQKMTLVASVEHPMVTHAEWDPTGRFLCSYVSSLTQQMDNAYMIWNVNGQKVFEQKIPRLSHATWRPLAQSLLDAADLAQIRKEMPARSARYKEETLAQQKKADDAVSLKKKAALEKYRKVMDAIHAHIDRNDYELKRRELIERSPSWKKQQENLRKEAPITEEKEVEE
jgi:translation initiation factor 3 subunit B